MIPIPGIRQNSSESRPALIHPLAFSSMEDACEWKRALLRSAPDSENMPDGAYAKNGMRTAKMARLEAALFVAESPMSLRKLTQYSLLSSTTECKGQIEALNACYDQLQTPFRIEQIAGDFQLLSRPKFSLWLNRLHQRKSEMQLSRSVLETLSIIAYRQPMTRADVESVRGVQSSELIKQLMERGLVRIDGYEDTLGRPYLYRTTKKFLELFGLQSLDEMPMYESLVRRKPEGEAAETESELLEENDEGELSEVQEDIVGETDDDYEVNEYDVEDEDYWDDEEAAA